MAESSEYRYGIHAVSQLLQQPQFIAQLWLLENPNPRLQALALQAEQAGIPLQWVNRAQLTQRVGAVAHQGIVARYQPSPQKIYTEADLFPLLEQTIQPKLLVLDGLQDPHNLGACLRTADASGVTAVIIPKDRSVTMTAVVSKVACGAAETVPLITVTNLTRTLTELKQYPLWIIGTAGDAAQSLYATDLTLPLALVMGAEGKGLRRLTRETCDQVVSIPMQGTVSSLNIAVATGICLFEILRQQRYTSHKITPAAP